MRTPIAVSSILTVAAFSVTAGQVTISPRASTAYGLMPSMAGRIDYPRAAIGIVTSTSSGPRDTLGLLVSAVTRNSPAEKAGIEEGNRIAAINGVNLRLAAADVGDPDMANLMTRRLLRELDKVKPTDDVDLRVYGSGQVRSMKVKTVDPESLYTSRSRDLRRDMDDRPVLGIGIGSSGSRRDTLGIFVMSVDDAGPAAKAGLEEGQRIAAINGVDVRVAHDDAGDDFVSAARISRFNRELSKVKVGDPVDLRVYSNGQFRNVKVTTVAASSLPNRGRSMTIIRNGGGLMRTMPPDDISFDGEMIGTTVRRALERAQAVTGERLQDLGHVLDGVGRGLDGFGGQIRWFEDVPPADGWIAPSKLAPMSSRKIGRTISM
jgi:membrane-associated protease RseP (regulator of RpoE activity)